MRLEVRSLGRAVKDDQHIEFVAQRLTSYGGLELLSRYFRRFDKAARLRHALAMAPSDCGSARLALLLVALFYVGARRLEHLRDLAGDPLIGRFCSLARIHGTNGEQSAQTIHAGHAGAARAGGERAGGREC